MCRGRERFIVVRDEDDVDLDVHISTDKQT